MSARFVCDRCGTTFDEASDRCPNCLRKTGVREVERASGEAARLARGDHAQTAGARRATGLFVAVALTIVLGVGLSLTWRSFDEAHLTVPAIVAVLIAAGAFVRAALRLDAPSDPEPWASFATRCGVGGGVAAWAFASGLLALATTSGISVFFAVLMSVVVFVGGIVPVLLWLRAREDAPERPPGKWR